MVMGVFKSNSSDLLLLFWAFPKLLFLNMMQWDAGELSFWKARRNFARRLPVNHSSSFNCSVLHFSWYFFILLEFSWQYAIYVSPHILLEVLSTKTNVQKVIKHAYTHVRTYAHVHGTYMQTHKQEHNLLLASA